MNDKINEALVQLENDLQEIDSARKQVEKAILACIELQKTVIRYVTEVNEMCIKVKQTANDFKTNTENAINDFKEQNRLLNERVEELNQLREEIKIATKDIGDIKDKIVQISKDLKESQGAQDEVLNEIKQKVSEVNEAITNHTNNILERIDVLNRDFLNEIQNLRHDICNISDHLLHVISICKEIKDDLHTSTNDIKTLIEKTNKETAKNININRWIMIAGFIIVVILLFVFR